MSKMSFRRSFRRNTSISLRWIWGELMEFSISICRFINVILFSRSINVILLFINIILFSRFNTVAASPGAWHPLSHFLVRRTFTEWCHARYLGGTGEQMLIEHEVRSNGTEGLLEERPGERTTTLNNNNDNNIIINILVKKKWFSVFDPLFYSS